MATVTLDYNARNIQARKALEYIQSLGLFRVHTNGEPRNGITFTDFGLTTPEGYKFNRDEANAR